MGAAPVSPHDEIHSNFFKRARMTPAHPDSDPVPTDPLVLVCTPHAWAWGGLASGDAWIEQAWPEGEPPLEFPQELLTQTWRQWRASWDRPLLELPDGVRLLCASWHHDAAPDWWPHRKSALGVWRDVLRPLNMPLVQVQQARCDDPGSGLRDWALHTDARNVWPAAHEVAWSLAQWNAWQRLGASLGLVLLLHLLMTLAIEPAWQAYRVSWRAQQERAEQEEAQQQAQARAQAAEEERQAQLRQWLREQRLALKPVQELAQLLEQVGQDAAEQVWIDLRRAQGNWTLVGITRLAVPVSDLVRHPKPEWGMMMTATDPVLWPPEPAWGWPAQRFQWQTTAAAASSQESKP